MVAFFIQSWAMFHSNSRQICHQRSLWFVAQCCLGIKYTQFKTIYFHTRPQKSIYFHKKSIYSHTMSIYFNNMFTRSPWYPLFFTSVTPFSFQKGVSCRISRLERCGWSLELRSKTRVVWEDTDAYIHYEYIHITLW